MAGGRKKGQGKGRSKTSPQQISAVERRTQALGLRKAGVTYDEIALRLGYASKSGAFKAVMTALNAMPVEGVEELRAMEGQRLDELQMNLWRRARAGDKDAVEQVLKIMNRRARLLGLDAPAGLDVTSGGKAMEFTLKIGNGAGHPNPPEDQ